MRTFNLLRPVMASLVIVSIAHSSQAVGDLCTGGAASGSGLRGAYYSFDSPEGSPMAVRIDASVNYDTVRKPPAPATAPNLLRVRWCGWVRPIVTGSHRFGSQGRRLRIVVNRQTVVSPGTSQNSVVQLEAGQTYPIWIQLDDVGKSEAFSLQWTPPFGATYDVPPTVLFPPVETVNSGC